MNDNLETKYNNLIEHIKNDASISPLLKQLFADIQNGKKLVPLSTDAMAKKVFSPDIYPDRYEFLLQRIMNNRLLQVKCSATNEPPLDNEESKKLIFDITAWLKDHQYSDLEMQVMAQEFFFKRFEVHTSRMLMLQYSASKGNKDSTDYDNVPGVILIALMLNSPKYFDNFESDRYIHRVTKAVSDTGIEFPLLRQIAFVQLDKALEMFINKTYNDDEDVDLLAVLAMIADINNDQVREAIKDSDFCSAIYKDAESFSQDKEVQLMTFEDELAIMDRNTDIKYAKKEGEKRVNSLYSWLNDNGRINDVTKAFTDEDFRDKLFDEYDTFLSHHKK